MSRRVLGAVVVAALVLLAGCTGGPAGNPATTATSSDSGGTATTPDAGGSGSDTGTVRFYVSDEPNAIDDFEHLNVTITAVGLHRADGDETPTPENDTASPTATPGNETASLTATAAEAEDEGPEEQDGDDGERGQWVEHEVNATVDLTELVGANATELDVLEAPAGTYDKVFVYVDGIDAVLENGEEVNVKLPSEKLHLDKQFEVGNGEAVEFVFDIAVHEAGNSGKYVLQPVVSESGTGDEVDIEERDEGDDERGNEGDDERGNGTLARVAVE